MGHTLKHLAKYLLIIILLHGVLSVSHLAYDYFIGAPTTVLSDADATFVEGLIDQSVKLHSTKEITDRLTLMNRARGFILLNGTSPAFNVKGHQAILPPQFFRATFGQDQESIAFVLGHEVSHNTGAMKTLGGFLMILYFAAWVTLFSKKKQWGILNQLWIFALFLSFFFTLQTLMKFENEADLASCESMKSPQVAMRALGALRRYEGIGMIFSFNPHFPISMRQQYVFENCKPNLSR